MFPSARILVVPCRISVTAFPDNINQRIQTAICISLRFREMGLGFRKLAKSFFVLFLELFIMYLEINQVVYLFIMIAIAIPQFLARTISRSY